MKHYFNAKKDTQYVEKRFNCSNISTESFSHVERFLDKAILYL